MGLIQFCASQTLPKASGRHVANILRITPLSTSGILSCKMLFKNARHTSEKSPVTTLSKKLIPALRLVKSRISFFPGKHVKKHQTQPNHNAKLSGKQNK